MEFFMTAALFSVFFCLIPKHFSLIYWSVCELIFHLHFGCSGAVHLTVRKPVDIIYIYIYTYFIAYLDGVSKKCKFLTPCITTRLMLQYFLH